MMMTKTINSEIITKPEAEKKIIFQVESEDKFKFQSSKRTIAMLKFYLKFETWKQSESIY